MRALSPVAEKLIKDSEGLVLHPYRDPGPKGTPTIGWGTTVYPNGKAVSLSDPSITTAQAQEYFDHDIAEVSKRIEPMIKVPCNDNQFSAFLSFAYNVGIDDDHDGKAEGFGDSTLLKKFNARDITGCAAEFDKWIKSSGKVLPGLVTRRAAEKALFLTLVETTEPSVIDNPKAIPDNPDEPAWFEPYKQLLLELDERTKKAAGDQVAAGPSDAVDQIVKLNPQIKRQSVVNAMAHLSNPRIKNKNYMLIADMSRHDYEKRFHLINLKDNTSKSYFVAHGKNSDTNKDQLPDSFSNVKGSAQSSLGPMVLSENYVSSKKNPNSFNISRRIDGLDDKLNSNVRVRGVVFHDAFYVSAERAAAHNVGDSEGCFAVNLADAKEINPLIEGCLLYSWDDSLPAIN